MLPAAFGPGARRREPSPRSRRCALVGGAPSGSPRPRAGRGLRLSRYAAGRGRFPAPPLFAGGRPAGRPAAGRPRRYRLRAAPRAAPRALRGFGVVGPSARAWRYPPRWTRSPSARSCRAGRPAVALRRGRAAPGRRGSPRRSRRRRSGPGGPRGAAAATGRLGRRCRPARAPGPLFLCFCCGFRARRGARGPAYKKRTKNSENGRKTSKIVAKTAHQRYNRGVQTVCLELPE